MKWRKQGLIYGPTGNSWWAQRWALQPTPILRPDGTIRIFAGFRTQAGISRVGYVDVDADNPSRVLGVSQEPVLDLGIPGAFDENGVVPCAIVARQEKLFLYYAGYQLGQKVKFYVFGGLAISNDGGESFQRVSRVPICDRTDDELYFRVIHTMMLDGDEWRAWYGGGSEYSSEEGRQLPRYDIRHAFAPNGMALDNDYQVCLAQDGDEYRVGRPYVFKDDKGLYRMLFSAGTAATGYRLAYAISNNGIDWTRRDQDVGIDVSPTGWDSAMQAYPAVIRHKDITYLFYNGNNYGEDGFGYAVLEEW
jgi:hypothetical protein